MVLVARGVMPYALCTVETCMCTVFPRRVASACGSGFPCASMPSDDKTAEVYRLGVSETEVEVLFQDEMSEDIEKNYVGPLKVFTKTVDEFDACRKELCEQTVIPIYPGVEERTVQYVKGWIELALKTPEI